MRSFFTRVPSQALWLLLIAVPAWAADDTTDQVLINRKGVKWSEAPPSMPKGAKIAVLHGDPGKPGPFVLRLMAPSGYKIAPHWHSQPENLTVISGTLFLGSGDKLDMSHAHALKVGGYHYLPAKAHHFAYTKTPTIVQVNGEGPFDIVYVNADDDPQKVAKQ